MSHNRNTCAENAFYRTDDFFPAFQLQGIGMALLHDADGRCKTFHFVSLIRTERHIHHYHCALYAAHDGLGMINHLVEGYGQCSHVARHYVGSGVAHQDDVHTCAVNNLRHGIVVRGQHRYFFASLFHLNKAMRSYFTSVV